MAYQSAFLYIFPLNHEPKKSPDARSTARETETSHDATRTAPSLFSFVFVIGVFREDAGRGAASDGQKNPLKSPMPGSASTSSPIFATNAVKKMNALLLLEPVSPPSPEDACVARR